MEVPLTSEQESRLRGLAAHLQVDPARLVTDVALGIVKHDEIFFAYAQKGIDQLDRGEFIEEEEMDARVERMLRR
jgi:hypothetical protein